MHLAQLLVRKLELKDINTEYFQLLQNLSLISLSDMDVSKNQTFFYQLDENHQIWIVENSANQKIIGTGTILIENKLIRNYGIGAQIIKDLKIKNMTLITKSPKKVIGLDGYGIKITKQEII